MNFSIHPAAEQELLDAVTFYRSRGGQQLAEKLLDEFERSIALLRDFPDIGPIWHQSARLLPIDRFPYSLVYYLDRDEVRIVAFTHQRRSRDYWSRRR